jgi:hypothetical protein
MGERVIAKDLYIGETSDKERLYLDVRVRQDHGTWQTVEHDTVTTREELSIIGNLRVGRHDVGGGQCIDRMWSVLGAGKLARGADPADVRLIADVWERWHLNAMRPGCAHVEVPEGTKSTSDRLDNTPPCPRSGYRWGSAWLYEPLPDGLVDELSAACARVAARA